MKRVHALLIGIDAYEGPRPLRGCVNDIDAIQALLIGRLHVEPTAIRRLAAPRIGQPGPTAVPSSSPTRAAILGELADLAHCIDSGDRVFVYYAGHGTQLTIDTREGGRFRREAIVPVDNQYIFDWELSGAVQALAARTPSVCVVLDCCSAAGATRDGLQARGHDAGSDSVAASTPAVDAAAIARTIGACAEAATVVAACLDDERACERSIGDACHGVFTGALLDALAGIDDLEEVRWSQIWRPIQWAVAAANPAQHPWVSAGSRRHVFGGAREPSDAPPPDALGVGPLRVFVPPDARALATAVADSDLLALADAGAGDVAFAVAADGHWVLTDDVYASDGPALPSCPDVVGAIRLAEHYARYSAPLRIARDRDHDLLRVAVLDCSACRDGLPAAEAQDPAMPVLATSDRGEVSLAAGRASDGGGDRFCLRVENHHDAPLFVSVLDCDSDGGVGLIAERLHVAAQSRTTVWHPSGLGRPFRATLADSQRVGIDRFVFLATTDRASEFEHLELHATFTAGASLTRDVSAHVPQTVDAACTVTMRLREAMPADGRMLAGLRGELGRGLAVVIGIDSYADGNELHNARADAEAIGAVLHAHHDFDVAAYPDANLATLQALCRELPARALGYEQIVVYFAGHGTATLVDGVLEGRLAAADTKFSVVGTSLAMAELRQACEAAAVAPHDNAHARYRLQKRHVLVLLDCCAAGAFSSRKAIGLQRQPLFRERYERLLAHRGVQFIGAAEHRQLASDAMRRIVKTREGRAHSPFATALLAALMCADGDGRRHPVDRDHDGVFLASELYEYIARELYRWSVDLPAHYAQRPVFEPLRGHEGGDLVFAASKRRLALPPAEQLSAHTSPYRGVKPYGDDERDERVFFGRDDAIEALDRVVAEHPLTVVTGRSRTGKSSLVQTGLARQHRAAGWRIHRVVPGATSIATLPAGPARRLVIVDPLDDLADAQSRGFIAELEALVAARPDDRVVATLREGRESLLREGAVDGSAPRWFSWSVPEPTYEELKAVIQGPADVSMLFYEEVVVDALATATYGQPAAFALLSRALEAMFQRQVPRGDRTLTDDDFQAVGTIERAIDERATALFASLPADQRMLTRIMVQLADVRGTKLEAKATPIAELGVEPGREADLPRLLDRLEDDLLIVRGAQLETAHPAVLASFGIEELFKNSLAALRLLARLAASALANESWNHVSLASAQEVLGCAPSFGDRVKDLVRPRRVAHRIAAKIPVALTAAEHAVLEDSAALRRRTALWLSAATAFVAVTAVGGWLLMARAEHARLEEAKADELSAVGSAAELVRDHPREIRTGIERALAAIRAGEEHSPMLLQALLRVADAPGREPDQVRRAAGQVLALSAHSTDIAVVMRRRGAWLVGKLPGEPTPIPGADAIVAISPRGTWVASVGNTLRLWCVVDQKWIGTPIQLPPESRATSVVFSRDEHRVAVAIDAPTPLVGVWDVATRNPVGPIAQLDGRIVLALDSTGDRVFANDTIRNFATGTEVRATTLLEGHPAVAAFSPDDTRLAVGGDGVDVAPLVGEVVAQPQRSNAMHDRVTALAFSDDGARLAATTLKGDAVVWSTRGGGLDVSRYLVGGADSGINAGSVAPIVFGDDFVAALASNGTDVDVWIDEPLAPVLKHDDAVLSVAVSPSKRWLVTGSIDGTARVWSARSGAEQTSLRRIEAVTAVAATDTWFAAGGIDRTVETFDARGGGRRVAVQQLSRVHAIAISPGGSIASASGDGTVVVADRHGVGAETFEHARKKSGDAFGPDDAARAVTAVAWANDHLFASAGQDGSVKVWSVGAATPIHMFHHAAPVSSLAWSANGARLVSTAVDGTAEVWKLADGPGLPLAAHHHGGSTGRFSADASQVVTASEDGTVRISDADTGEVIRAYDQLGPIHDAAFASCSRVVTAGNDGLLRVWDTSGRELVRIAAHAGEMTGPLLLLDDDRVATAGQDGVVRVVPICTARVIRALCTRRDRIAGNPGPCPVTEEEEKACCWNRDGL